MSGDFALRRVSPIRYAKAKARFAMVWQSNDRKDKDIVRFLDFSKRIIDFMGLFSMEATKASAWSVSDA